ncbi:MAG: oligopeptide transporter, OPT family [Candidatus Solibacter usitatus]|nr:oligopeptide transporter, OPT family [Candidatus Solibacter usitatus]
MNASKPQDAELTIKAVALGLFLAFVFGAANAYLGLRAGQTIAATIPAAVIALALFRLPAFRGTILEQNIVRTAGSVGEALVAGAIFTIPSFVLAETGGTRIWTDLRSHYWEATLILLAGGLIGVLFVIPLRRPLCVDAQLPWPESVASAEIVKAAAESGSAARVIFASMGFGALMQFLKSDKGVQIFREYTEGFLTFPSSLIQHTGGQAVRHGGGIAWSTPSLSPALTGIGYIIGFVPSAVTFSGGLIAWWLLIPLLLFLDPDLARRFGTGGTPDVLAASLWRNIVRPIAVGAMLVAAASTMWSIRQSLIQSFRGALSASAKTLAESAIPTERDIPLRWVLAGIIALLVPITGIYWHFTDNFAAATVTALVMALAGFLLCACGAYLVGLVGSSNQPLSGLTLSGLLIAALAILTMGLKGAPGIAAVLGVAAVVACACSVSGSLIQDLKAGHLLGGTPWKMQLVEILAVVLLSFFLMGPIIALHEANLATGGIGGKALPAPQAGLMAQLAIGIVGGQMAWGLLGIGVAFGFALILCGARAPMLVAVGMYLPFDTTSAIFLGGLLKLISDKITSTWLEQQRAKAEERGILLASGLVSGEAIAGIVLAVTYLAGIPSFTQWLIGKEALGFFPQWGGWLSLAGFAMLALVLLWLPLRARKT